MRPTPIDPDNLTTDHEAADMVRDLLAGTALGPEVARKGLTRATLHPVDGSGMIGWRWERLGFDLVWAGGVLRATAAMSSPFDDELEPVHEVGDEHSPIRGVPWARRFTPNQLEFAVVVAGELLAGALAHDRPGLHPRVLAESSCPSCRASYCLDQHVHSTEIRSTDADGTVTIRTVSKPPLIECSVCRAQWVAPHPEWDPADPANQPISL